MRSDLRGARPGGDGVIPSFPASVNMIPARICMGDAETVVEPGPTFAPSLPEGIGLSVV